MSVWNDMKMRYADHEWGKDERKMSEKNKMMIEMLAIMVE